MVDKINVCVVGSGNWGTAIAKIVGANCTNLPDFEDRVTMFVYEEMVGNRKLSEIINTTHENVKYLPGYKLPPNVVAISDLVEAGKNADVLIFVLPAKFIISFCKTLLGKLKPNTIAVSMIKGFIKHETGGIDLVSHVIARHLKIPCAVFMGANLAYEIAAGNYCETTIGCRDFKYAKVLRDLFQTKSFRVIVVDDADAVEIIGTLRDVVAIGAGMVDGLGMSDNTKGAVMRIGLLEMIRFVDVFYPGSKLSTFFESCGITDMVTACFAGRHRQVADAMVKARKSLQEVKDDMFPNLTLQGLPTLEMMDVMLKSKGLEEKFPLFRSIHKICLNEANAQTLVECLRNYPDHIYHPTHIFPL